VNRIDRIFSDMMARGEKILANYFPVGDTILENQEVEWAKKYFANGTNVLEVILPFEEPALDGPVARASMERALSNIDIVEAFERIRQIREAIPERIIQVMGYYEIVERFGTDKFASMMAASGVDAILAPNAPPNKLREYDEGFGKHGISNMRFAPFTLTSGVLDDLATNALGYVFLQAVDGATGTQPNVSPKVRDNIAAIKAAGVTAPVVAGFGISNADQLKEVIGFGADGAVVGSAVLKALVAGNGEEFITGLSTVLTA